MKFWFFVFFVFLYFVNGQGDEEFDFDALLETLRQTTPPPPSTAPFPPSPAEFGDPVDLTVSTRNPPPKSPKYRKSSRDEESTRVMATFQQIQRELVTSNYREGKKQEILLSSSQLSPNEEFKQNVTCVTTFYRHGYGAIDGCSPSDCWRIVVDDFAPKRDVDELFDTTQKAMKNLFHQGGSTSLAAVTSGARLGMKGQLLVEIYLRKAKLEVMRRFGCEKLFDSGALLTRLIADAPNDEWELEPNHNYWNPHVDKANIPTYDYSALLYLTSQHEDFEGGEFVFLDKDADRIIEPVKGRLLMFTSGPENLHQVRKVTRGTRLILAMWFTCSAEHQYRTDE